ncbi:tetratricopeptide repeat protein [Streptomyces sp. MI02-7b]|uniref:tetratricopeptide repeat protein n=1 Tax=Streptomyces sp. MI02-7b TaxID=462941 RepID=UPI0029B8667D|nr:tetratricopeptide repeat protein [Streptomyces sp. MI02-7b]MDX3074983.1 tetratricopeptide repeat protein [Streptomyces sp. MI02-7b]
MADHVLDADASVAACDDGLREPPVQTPAPGTLPPDVPHFVGRRRELEELRADIDRPGLATLRGRSPDGSRVLLVAGRPGSGRTSLALRLAHDVADHYPDGQFFVRLSDNEGEPVPPGQSARALLRALGVGAEPGAEGAELSAALRTALAARRAVLVLDDVVDPRQLLDLLPKGSGNLFVATSEGPLPGVPDVRPCTLGGLDPAACVDLLAQAVGRVRVTNDPKAAEALAHECGGHPAALRLIGAWLATQPRTSVADATRRLHDIRADSPAQAPAPAAARESAPVAPTTGDGVLREDVGRRGTADALPVDKRSRVVPRTTPAPSADPAPTAAPAPAAPRATAPPELLRAFRFVYGALAPAVARMLRLLALAPTGLVDAQTASALAGCSVGEAEGTLENLAGCGLLHAEPVADPLPRQYRVPGWLTPSLHELLRGTDKPAETQLARARMLERTVRLLHACRLGLEGADMEADGLPKSLRFADRPAAAGWLRDRLPVLLAAARLAVADGELDTLARRLMAALVRALAADPGGGENAAERYQLHHLVLDVAQRRGLHREKAAALLNIGDLDVEGARPLDALDRYRAALVAAREGFDGDAEGRALEAIAGTYLELDDPQRASDWYGRALALRQARGELIHAARLHGRLGALQTYAGRYGHALREWRAAVAAYRRLKDLPAQARALTEVARVQEYAGHPEDALRTCRDALYWARQAGERRLEGAVLLRMADTLDRLGDRAGARLQRAAARRLLPASEIPRSPEAEEG